MWKNICCEVLPWLQNLLHVFLNLSCVLGSYVWMNESWRERALPQTGLLKEDLYSASDSQCRVSRSISATVEWYSAELDVCWILGMLKSDSMFSASEGYSEQLHIESCQMAFVSYLNSFSLKPTWDLAVWHWLTWTISVTCFYRIWFTAMQVFSL